MSKQIDNLLDSLIKEIDAKDGQPAPKESKSTRKEPKPASDEARGRAEAIAKGVNKSYRRPPEPVRRSIPAPHIKPVVEPDPVSHFTDGPSADPAIRMHDRLDESTLPAPDAERRPNQIMDIDGKSKKRRRRRNSGARSIPAPPEAPKRRIPHINVPDELPPDVGNAPYQPPEEPEPDAEREAIVRSRAEKIREQLKKRTLEETPIIPPPSSEEIDDMISDLEQSEPSAGSKQKENNSIFAYLHQVLGVEDEPEVPDEDDISEEAERPRWFNDAPASVPMQHMADGEDTYDDDEAEFDEDDAAFEGVLSGLHYLDDEEEIEEKRDNPIVSFFKNLFGKKTAARDETDGEDTFDEDAYDEDMPDDDALDEDFEEFAEQDFAEETFADSDVTAADSDSSEDSENYGSLADFRDPELDEIIEDFENNPDLQVPPKKSDNSFFREAFDESAEEIAEMKAEPIPQPGEESSAKPRFLSRNSYFIAGVLVFVLALVGLITVASGIAKAAGMFFGGGSLKNQLQQALYPVAVVDVPAFNEPAELTADGALSAAIVDILMHDDLSGYTETFDMIAVPAEDILERGRQMFGVDVQTKLSTLHAAGESFVYDETTGCYNVPTAPMIFSYSPEIQNVKRSGDTYEVTVVYNSDVADWQEHSRNFTEGNTKTMQATIEKKSSGYRIVRLVSAE